MYAKIIATGKIILIDATESQLDGTFICESTDGSRYHESELILCRSRG